MSSDFGSSRTPEPGQTGRWLVDSIRAVQGPGTAMQWFGMISVFLSVVVLLLFLVSPETLTDPAYKQMRKAQEDKAPEDRTPLPPYKKWAQQAQIEYVVASLLSLAGSFVVTIGGMKMKQVSGYAWALIGAILSIVPCTNMCCCAGLPIGLWALVALLGSDVRLAFTRVSEAGGLDAMLANVPEDGGSRSHG
jgi:hypothetical protein